MKVFIDASAWITVVDPGESQHELFKEQFRLFLNNGDRLFTHNVAVGMALDEIRRRNGGKVAQQFYESLEEAYSGAHLHILWVGRKTQREAIRFLRNNPDTNLTVFDFAAFIFMNRRRIRTIFTQKKDFQKLGLIVYPDI